MALVAVLSMRNAAHRSGGDLGARWQGELGFAGQTVIEFQARQVHGAGAGPIAILVDDVTPALSQAVDRLRADGIAVTLVREMPALGRMIGQDDEILLIADGHILPTGHVELLAGTTGGRLLVLPSNPATARFERIDAGHVWAGAARAPASTVYRLIDMLGDWDFALTLVRSLAQEGADRSLCAIAEVYDGLIVCATDQATADAATDALVRSGGRAGQADDKSLDDWIAGGMSSALAAYAIRHGMAANVLRGSALGLGVLGLVLVIVGFVSVGLVATLAAYVADRAVQEKSHILRLAPVPAALAWSVPVLVLVVIAVAGILDVPGGLLADLGAVMTALLLGLVPTAHERGGAGLPPWTRLGPGLCLLVLFVGALAGMLEQALVLCGIGALASLAYGLLAPPIHVAGQQKMPV
jgi:hypothetical protein